MLRQTSDMTKQLIINEYQRFYRMKQFHVVIIFEMSIQVLNQELIQTRSKYISDINQYKLKVHSLEETIHSLETENKKLKFERQEANKQLSKHTLAVNQAIKQSKTLLKAREDDIYLKELQMIKMEQDIKKAKDLLQASQSRYSDLQNKCNQLLECLGSQENQLQNHINLNQSLICFIQDYIGPNELMMQQKAVLLQFNKELQIQVNELQSVNQSLISRTRNYMEVIQELKLQNTQNNDLISLSERFLSSLQASA